MALGTTHASSTTLDTMIPELWGSKMNNFFRQRLYIAKFFTDLSSEFVNGGDVLHIPSITQMTANTKGNGSQVTLNAPTETKVDLTIDTWKEVSFLIEDREAHFVANSYAIQERYMTNAAYTAAKALEQAIVDLFDSATYTQGASTASLVDSDLRGAIKQLSAVDVPLDECAFFFSAKLIWTDLQALDRFTLAINSAAADPRTTGAVTSVYTIPVYRNNLVGAFTGSGFGSNVLAHRDAIVWASLMMRTQANYIPEYLGTLVTADILFGVAVNRPGAMVWIKTAS